MEHIAQLLFSPLVVGLRPDAFLDILLKLDILISDFRQLHLRTVEVFSLCLLLGWP